MQCNERLSLSPLVLSDFGLVVAYNYHIVIVD